jgi:hypothetical protein
MDSFRALFGGPPPPPPAPAPPGPPAAYTPGMTYEQYAAMDKAAFVPQDVAAGYDENGPYAAGKTNYFANDAVLRAKYQSELQGTLYKPGMSLNDFLAEAKAAYVPQYWEADASEGTPAGSTYFGFYQGDIENATNQYYKKLYAGETPVTPIAPGWGLQDWVPRKAENGRETQSWEGWANLIGFEGPTTRPTGYDWINGEETGTGNGWVPTTEATPEFKQALANYGFQQTQDKHGNGIVQMLDSNRNVIGQQRVYSGPGGFSQFVQLGIAALVAYAAPQMAAELIGAMGAGSAAAATTLAEIGAGATVPGALSATGAAAASGAAAAGTQGVMQGKDFGDTLESMASGAATSLASNYLTQNLTPLVSKNVSSFLNNLSPEDLTTAQSKYVDTATQAAGNVAGNVVTNELKSVITGKPYDFEKDVVSQFVGQAYGAVAGDVAKKIGATPAQVSSIVQFGLDGDAAKLIKSVGSDLARGAIKQFNLNVLTNTNDSLVAAANDVTSRSTSAADFFEVPSNTVGGPNDPYLYPAPVTMADDNGANVQQAEIGQTVARDESTQPHIVGEDPIITQLVSAGLLPEGMTQEQIDAVTAEIRAAEAMADGDTSAQTVEIAHRKIPGLTEGEQQSFQDFLDSVNTPVNLPPSPQRVEVIGKKPGLTEGEQQSFQDFLDSVNTPVNLSPSPPVVITGTRPDLGLPDDNLDPDNLLGGTVIDTSSLEGSGPPAPTTAPTPAPAKTPSAPSAPSAPAKTPSAPAAAPSQQPAVQLRQELMQLSDRDLEMLLDPTAYLERVEQKRNKKSKKSSNEESLMDLLETLGYRS